MVIKILIRNSFRHNLRSILTIAGIAIAVLAYGLLHTVIDAWYAGVAASSANRLVTRNSISLVFRLPLSYREKIRAADGVKIVSYGNWFGGYYRDEKDFFANFAVEPVSYLKLYPEYKISENETMKKVRPFSADNVGFYIIGIDRPENAAGIAEAIDAMFKNSLAETLTET